MRTVSTVLTDLHALLGASPTAWTHHANARDVFGRHVSNPAGPEAICWCLMGGLAKLLPGGFGAAETPEKALLWETEEFLNKAVLTHRRKDTPNHYISWNDYPGRTQAQVLSLILSAKELADAAE